MAKAALMNSIRSNASPGLKNKPSLGLGTNRQQTARSPPHNVSIKHESTFKSIGSFVDTVDVDSLFSHRDNVRLGENLER